MNPTTAALTDLFERIPRRHSPDNVKEIMAILLEFESVLITIEAQNPYYEKNTAAFFEDLQKVRGAIKKSTDSKASKKNKDDYFAEASGDLKGSMESLMQVYGDGSKTG
jgi:hypothetical protein